MSASPPSECLVLGGGITGCAAAHFLRAMGTKAILVERDAELGGMARSYELDGLLYDFGPHMLHATNPGTIRLYKQFDIREVDYFAKMSFDDTLQQLVDFPFSLDTIFQLPSEVAKQVVAELYALDPRRRDRSNLEAYLRSVSGDTLYRCFNEGYSRKFWGVPPTSVPSNGAASWISFRTTDKRLYPEWQAYPNGGFNQLYSGLSQGIERRATDVLGLGPIRSGRALGIRTSAGELHAEYVICTIPPETVFPDLPPLKYIGKAVVALRLAQGPFHPVGVGGVYFPGERWRFNRIVEYPAMTEIGYPNLPRGSVVTVEYPIPLGVGPLSETEYVDDATRGVRVLGAASVTDARCHIHQAVYPFRDEEQLALHERYRERIAAVSNVSLTGRYGNFVYVNMNHCIEMVAKLVAKLYAVSQGEVFQQAAAVRGTEPPSASA